MPARALTAPNAEPRSHVPADPYVSVPVRTTIETPIGALTLLGDDDGALTAVLFACERYVGSELDDPTALAGPRAAFERYFAGDPDAFRRLSVRYDGTPLQRAVWGKLLKLPFGSTTTYGALAHQLAPALGGTAPHPRAVGAANARTPIPIVMACHRVVGSSGALRGYRGGLELKRALLQRERAALRAHALTRGPRPGPARAPRRPPRSPSRRTRPRTGR